MSQIASFYLIKNNQRQELSDGNCSAAVSYTHLDVYKRQTWNQMKIQRRIGD